MIRIVTTRRIADLVKQVEGYQAVQHDDQKEIERLHQELREERAKDSGVVDELPSGVEQVILTAAGIALADRALVVWEWGFDYNAGHRPWHCQGCGQTRGTSLNVRWDAAEHARYCRALPRPTA